MPHLNPDVMTREELELLRAVSTSMGSCSSRRPTGSGSGEGRTGRRRTRSRPVGSRRSGPPASSGPVHERDPDSDRETREERIDACSCSVASGRSTGTCRRASSRTSARSPDAHGYDAEPALEDHLWTIAVARILLGPGWHVQAPPNLAYEDFPRLLDAGIDDWGGVSPVTIDHVNPEAPWPEIERLAEATRSRGLELAPARDLSRVRG